MEALFSALPKNVFDRLGSEGEKEGRQKRGSSDLDTFPPLFPPEREKNRGKLFSPPFQLNKEGEVEDEDKRTFLFFFLGWVGCFLGLVGGGMKVAAKYVLSVSSSSCLQGGGEEIKG